MKKDTRKSTRTFVKRENMEGASTSYECNSDQRTTHRLMDAESEIGTLSQGKKSVKGEHSSQHSNEALIDGNKVQSEDFTLQRTEE